MHVVSNRPQPMDLAKALVICLAMTMVPLATVVPILAFFGIAPSDATPTPSDGGGWYDLAVGIFMGPFTALVCGVFLALALRFGWNVSRLLRRWFIRKSNAHAGDEGAQEQGYVERYRGDLDFATYFASFDWFNDLFFGLLAFLGVVFPVAWGVVASFASRGLWYYLDVLTILSLAVAIPVMALGTSVAVWVCAAAGVMLMRALGFKSLRWMKEEEVSL